MINCLCTDLDEDCFNIKDKIGCAKYDFSTGICPFLYPQIFCPQKDPPQVINWGLIC